MSRGTLIHRSPGARRDVESLYRRRLAGECRADHRGLRQAAGALITAIVRELKKEGGFTLPGFGTFRVVKTKARAGLNPRTGETVKIKAGRTVRFKASPTLEENYLIEGRRRGYSRPARLWPEPAAALRYRLPGRRSAGFVGVSHRERPGQFDIGQRNDTSSRGAPDRELDLPAGAHPAKERRRKRRQV